MDHFNKRRMAATALAIVVLSAACRAGGPMRAAGTQATLAATPAAPRPNLPWTLPGVVAIDGPTFVDNVAFVTVRDDDKSIHSVALDPRTGVVLWKHPASTGSLHPGMGPGAPSGFPTSRGPVAVDIEPDGAGFAVVGRAARSGQQLWRKPTGFTFGPGSCGPQLCYATGDPNRPELVIADPYTGVEHWRTPAGAAHVIYGDDHQLVVMALGDPIVVAYDATTGHEQWRTALASLLGAGVTTNGGSGFERIGGALIGAIGPYVAAPGSAPSPWGMISLRLSDGHPNWVRAKVEFGFNFPQSNPSTPVGNTLIGYRTRFGATRETYPAGLVGLDANTGSILWNRDIPILSTWASLTQLFDNGVHTCWLLGPAFVDPIVVDLLNGSEPPAGTSTEKAWSSDRAGIYIDTPQGQRSFVSGVRNSEQTPVDGAIINPPETPPNWVGATVSGYRIWIDADGTTHGAIQPS